MRDESGLNEVSVRAVAGGGEGLTDDAPRGDFPSGTARKMRARADKKPLYGDQENPATPLRYVPGRGASRARGFFRGRF